MSNFCSYCQKSVLDDHWSWTQGRRRCKIAKRLASKRYRERIKRDVDKLERRRQYHRDYHIRHPEVTRYKALVRSDKQKGFVTDISLDSYKEMIIKSCYYCSRSKSGGLDRMDSTRGHVWGNVVPCCEKCNNILTDLPFCAKEKLRAGLHEIQRENLLNNWTIPTKRRCHSV